MVLPGIIRSPSMAYPGWGGGILEGGVGYLRGWAIRGSSVYNSKFVIPWTSPRGSSEVSTALNTTSKNITNALELALRNRLLQIFGKYRLKRNSCGDL